jgi:MFS family permease
MATPEPRPRLDARSFLAALMTLSAAGLFVSGPALHAALGGAWTPHHAWMSVHWVFAILFCIAAGAHVVLNARPLARHLRGALAAGRRVRREVLLATAAVAVPLALALAHAQLAARHGG